MSKDVGKIAKKGILWVTISRVSYRIVEFIGGIFLARLLFPEDFGIMAIVMMVVHWAHQIRETGFSTVLIQRKDITEDHIFTVWTVNIVIGVITCVLVVVISPFVGRFFNNHLVGTVLAIISINFIFKSLSSIPLAILQRELIYDKYAMILFVEVFLSTIFTILLAFLNFKIWSLVLGRLSANIIEVVLSMVMTGSVPRFRYKHYIMKQIFSFSLWVFLRAHIICFINNIAYFIVSKRLGIAHLGFYERGANLVTVSQRQIGIGVLQVFFPAFSRIQEEERLRRAFKKVLLSTSLYNYPLLIGMLLVAPSFIPVVYGEKWMPTILPLQILCISGIPKSMEYITISLVTAKGKVKEHFLRLTTYFIFLSIACFVGSYYGIVGVATAVAISSIFLSFLLFNLLIHIGGLKLKDIIIPQIPALTYVIIMALGVKSWELFMRRFWQIESWQMLLSSIIIGGILYFGAFFIIRFKELELLKRELIGDIKSSFEPIIRKWKIRFNKMT